MSRIKFRARPGFGSQELLIELCGDHRAVGYPNVQSLLQRSLNSKPAPHPDPGVVIAAIPMDRFISYWGYGGNFYEIDDDWGGLFITAPKNNAQVISDVEAALLSSGVFEKESVNFADYA